MIKKILESNDENYYVTSLRNSSDGSTTLICTLNLNKIEAKKIKFKKVVLELDVDQASSIDRKVFYTSSSKEYLIDVVKGQTSDGKLYLDVTDEYQDATINGQTSLSFRIEGDTQNYYTFDDVYSKIHCEYTFATDENPDTAYLDTVSTTAGSGKINLNTGTLKFSTMASSSGNASFPISIGLSYNQNLAYSDNNQAIFGHNGDYDATKTFVNIYKSIPGFRVGKGWKLGCQQYLLKDVVADFEENKETSERFTWIDAEGNEINFEEKYYYLDENEKRVYVKDEEVTINADQSLTFEKNGKIFDILKECMSDSGYVLSSDNEKIKNIDKYNSNSEEIASLKQQLNSIKDAIREINGGAFEKGTKALQFDAEVNAYNSMLAQIKQTCISVGFEKVVDELIKEIEKIRDTFNLGEDIDTLIADSLIKATSLKSKLQEIMLFTITAKSILELLSQKSQMNDKLSELCNILSGLEAFFNTEIIKNIIKNANYDTTNFIKYYEHYFQANSFVLSLNESLKSIYNNFLMTQDQYELQNGQLNSQILKYTEQKEQLEEQLDTYLRQYPTHIITNPNSSVMLGFAKTDIDSQFRLVMIADSYEHYIFYNYDRENKLVSIVDSFENAIKLDYENELLSRIVDANGKEILFNYDANKCLRYVINDNVYNNYYYNANGYLIGAYNANEIIGVGFEYLNDKVKTTYSIHRYKSIKSGQVIPLTASDISDDEKISEITGNFQAKNKIAISYYDYQSTIVTDVTNNKSKTYQFDNSGKLICEYDNHYEKAVEGIDTDATTYQKSGSKVSFEASSADWSIDYSENCEFETNGFEITDYDWNIYTSIINGSSSNKTLVKTLSATEIQQIKDNKVSCLVLSGWAKADSAWINSRSYNTIDNNTNEFGDKLTNLVISNDSDRANRRFELSIELSFSNSSYVQKNYCSFDWMNTNWQYVALPIKIYDINRQNLAGVKLIFDYSNNYGPVSFFGMKLKEGTWSLNTYYENKLSYTTNSSSSFSTDYNYDKENNIKTKVAYGGLPGDEEDTEFATRYYHNPQGKLVKSIDSDNIVTEYVYDSHGNVIKELAYHKDEPANKFITEHEYNDNGVETSQIGALGEKTILSYDSQGNVREQTDALGNTISFGYDETTGALKNVTATDKCEPTSNVNEYRLGLLVKTSHNGSDYEFEYDGEGRKTAIKINGETYCTIAYEKPDIQIITYANGESVKTQILDDGKKSNIYYNNGTNTIVETNSGSLDNPTETQKTKFIVEDNVNGEDKYKTYYDKNGNITKYEVSGDNFEQKFSITNEYGFENTLSKTSIKIGGNTVDTENRSYTYGLNSKLTQIEHINTFTENPKLDKLGRVSGVSKSNGLSKNYKYIQVGERATNLLASETFGEDGKTKEKLSYTYNKLGNITEIRNNGELVVRYSYDELNRLVREDNQELGKSFFTSYDSAGNITQRKECDFTLDYFDNLEKTVVGEYEYADSGNKDRLLSFNGEECLYDSLGRPSTYRGNDVEWTHVNRLAEINGATFKYNYQGVRLFKTFGDKTTKFYYDGSKLLCQENETDNLYFYYGTEGVTAFKYNGNVYHYKKDMLGNILGIYDKNNCLIAKYAYDAWGNHKTFAVINGASIDISDRISYTESDDIATKLAILNPFRYRSYYFDIETGYYYLQSRYYDPQVGRFLSPDSLEYLDPETIHGLNLFAYCLNNPVMAIDPSGNFLISTAVAVGFWIGLGIGLIAGATAGGIVAHNIAKEHGATGWELFGWTMLGILGGGVVGGVVGAALGSAIGYGVGLLWGTAPVAGSNGTVVLWSGGKGLAGKAAAKFASETGAKLVTDSFAGKTLSLVGRFLPKSLKNFLWGKLSAEFVSGASYATIYLYESGIATSSTFYSYEIWTLLANGIERIIKFVS